jgi:hypothetical protein
MLSGLKRSYFCISLVFFLIDLLQNHLKNKFVKKQKINQLRPFLIDALKMQQNCLNLAVVS